MELSDFKQKYTTIFLGDALPPNKLILLKRGTDRKFAPNMYTGLGGHIGDESEFAQETQLEGALRELKEEAGLNDIQLTEFSRVIINCQRILFYFFGIFNKEILPPCTEGTLEWVAIKSVLAKNIIPTTKFFLENWEHNSWQLDPVTIFLGREDLDDVHSRTISLEIKEGLIFEK